MGGIWETQNKVLPGAYINFLSNKPLSITTGARGVVALPLELSVGSAGDIYIETATESGMKKEGLEPATDDYMLITEVLKNASKVIVYNLGTEHTVDQIDNFLSAMLVEEFNTIGYCYSVAGASIKIAQWVDAVRKEEGKNVQAVLTGAASDSEAIINVGNGVVLAERTLTPQQTCAWVAGATAGASISESLTNKTYTEAIDVSPRMSKTEMEEAITEGKFIFKPIGAQKVAAVYDINSLTTFTPEKSKDFRKNRFMRVIDGINNDITTIIEANYIGKVDNNENGRTLIKSALIDYFNELQRLNAVTNFENKDITVNLGSDKDAIVVDVYVQPVDSVEKMYMTVNVQ